MSIEQKAAEILVKHGYAMNLRQDEREHLPKGKLFYIYVGCNRGDCGRFFDEVPVEPFADTLEGRKQADAIEDWLRGNEPELFKRAKLCSEPIPYDSRQRRSGRLEWCLERWRVS